MAGYSLARLLVGELGNQRLGLLLLLAYQLLDAVQGVVAEELPGGQAEDVVEALLGADDRAGYLGGAALVPAGEERGCPARYPGMDVLLHHILDAVRALRSP